MKQKKEKEVVEDTEAAKAKKRQLELLQKKWISGLSIEPGPAPAVGEDFSIIADTKKDAQAPEAKPAPEEGALGHPALKEAPATQVDMEELKEYIHNIIRLEIDRAIRELKSEIDETSKSSKHDILDELKMELERIRSEVELAQPRKTKGIFDRF